MTESTEWSGVKKKEKEKEKEKEWMDGWMDGGCGDDIIDGQGGGVV